MSKRKYTGKYEKAVPRRGLQVATIVLIVAAVLSLLVGGVVAYLSANLGMVNNTFNAAQSPDPTIAEDFNNSTKTNVKVNVGDPGYAVFVRAAVVVTWKSGENGNVLGQSPVSGTDYTISYNTTDWFQDGDFWYCKKPVLSEGTTPVLIQSCTPVNGKTPTDYGLNVEIVAQTIQALGTTDEGATPAVTDAWGVVVNQDDPANPYLEKP